MQLLGGDIGGTKVKLALFEGNAGRLARRRTQSFVSHEHDGLAAIVKEFLAGEQLSLRAAAFGVAGPVERGHARITNLPWEVDANELRQCLRIDCVTLINDLEATAYGVTTLDAEDFLVLSPGATPPVSGNAAVIAAGTGLGEGLLCWDGVDHHPAPSAGGHADFAPCGEWQIALLNYLRARFDHVSFERVLSGPGLVSIYEFLRDTGCGVEPADLGQRLQREDPAAVISHLALEGTVPLCVQALEMFVAIYGAEAGNLALKVLATGGVYVAGGIAPKIRAKLVDGTFMAAFRAKGRMAFLMDKLPVRVVLNEDTALNGAAECAARMAQKEERQ